MTIADFATFASRIDNPRYRLPFFKSGTAAGTVRPHLSWLAGHNAGVAPTTPAVPTRDTVGALPGFAGGTNPRLVGMSVDSPAAVLTGGILFLCDRLSHQGGLDATVTSAQTTNLPTAALTRYTSGVGVWAMLEFYAQIGGTSTTITTSYTNEAGTASRTSKSTTFGGNNFREVGRSILVPLALGDSGVRSVESVTLAATTGTAGNFGVTLIKPLFFMPYGSARTEIDGLFGGGQLPLIDTNACLSLYWQSIGNISFTVDGFVTIVED